ncbi:MAG: DUF3224 domain-containing protein [Dehalococcoidia bacterium]
MAKATGTFVIDSWEETPFDEREGAKLTRTRIAKTFEGGVEGRSSGEFVMAMAGEGSAAYVGIERIVGAVDGRTGSFVLQHSATMTGGDQAATLLVVPHSGTGELQGLTGQAQVDVDSDGGHKFTLDYELE